LGRRLVRALGAWAGIPYAFPLCRNGKSGAREGEKMKPSLWKY